MRQAGWTLGIWLLVTLPVLGNGGTGEVPFESTKHDFGTVPRGAQLWYRFIWTNKEKTRREITDLRSSCACATVTPQPRVVEPGQKGTIEVLVDARRFVGPKTVTIQVMIGPDHPQAVVLQVSANSRADVVFNPGEVNFGVLAEGTASSQTLEVEYAGTLDWRITEVITPGPELRATYEESYRRKGNVGYRLKVDLGTEAPAGDFRRTLQIRTNDTANPVLNVLVQANIRPSVVMVPETVYFGGVRLNQPVVRRVTIRGETSFRILQVTSARGDLTSSVSTVPNKVHSLTLTWQPASEGELNEELIIQTDHERHPQLRLRVQGDGLK